MMPKYVADGLNFVKFWIFRAKIEIGFPPACARLLYVSYEHGIVGQNWAGIDPMLAAIGLMPAYFWPTMPSIYSRARGHTDGEIV